MDEYQSKKQAGFKIGFWSCNHQQTMRIIIEKRAACNIPLLECSKGF